jgi:hypothetical protein
MSQAPKTRRRWLFWTGLVVSILSIIGLFWFIVDVVQMSLQAERTHQVYIRVLGATTAFVHGHRGQWPKSWAELRMATGERGEWLQSLPDDIDDVRRRIDFDFDISAADVPAMNANDFSAIRQIGPNYGTDPVRTQMLIDATKTD